MAAGAAGLAPLAGRAYRAGRLSPFTAGYILLLWTLGAATGSLAAGPSLEVGFGVSSPLWTALTSALWCGNLAGYVGTTLLLLAFGPRAEREFGSRNTAALFLASHVLGVFLGAGLVRLGVLTGWSWLSFLYGDAAVVPSTGVVGLALALSFRLPALWRRRVRLLLVISLLVLALYSGYLEDVLRLSGGIVGLLLGSLLARPTPSAPQRDEVRVLVGLLLAASALGPVVAMLSPYANGPLAWFSDVLTLSSVLPSLLQLVLAEGLRNGRRFAWWSALAVNLGLTGLYGWYVVDGLSYEERVTPGILVEYGIPLLPPIGIVVVLLVTRQHFPLRYVFWRARPACTTAAAKARELMVRHGGSSLSYLTTWRGNHYWFTDDGQAAIAYRVVATIALTVGDPVGPPEKRREAIKGFAEFCAHHGWTPCLYSISEELRDAVTAQGWQAVQVAEDTVIPLPSLSFTGKKWQDVRTALNKAEKEGVTAEWWSYADAPLALTDQIRSISEEWVADKGLPEMGFTLGGIEELSGDGVRCLIAVDADRTVHGITSWLPVYVDGEVVGWTLDFMRRRACGFRGSMEFLIASAALTLRAEGAEFLSLSGAPLARLDRGERPRTLQRVLDLTGQMLEPVYGFRSLFAFKAKFQPVYHPMFMAYPDSAALPRIANAVGRAYLPGMSARQGLRLATKVIIKRDGRKPAARR